MIWIKTRIKWDSLRSRAHFSRHTGSARPAAAPPGGDPCVYNCDAQVHPVPRKARRLRWLRVAAGHTCAFVPRTPSALHDPLQGGQPKGPTQVRGAAQVRVRGSSTGSARPTHCRATTRAGCAVHACMQHYLSLHSREGRSFFWAAVQNKRFAPSAVRSGRLYCLHAEYHHRDPAIHGSTMYRLD